jgi:hypothetical protein
MFKRKSPTDHKAPDYHTIKNEELMIKVMLARGCYADARDLFKARGTIFK